MMTSLEEIMQAGQENARRVEAEERAHREGCVEVTCTRCETHPCGLCGTRTTGRLCPGCTEKQRRADLLAPGLGSIPPRFAWARFGAPELIERCGEANVRKAVLAASAPTVTLMGPTRAGKSSLAAAMLRNVLERASSERPHLATSRWASSFDISRARGRHPLGQGEAPAFAEALAARVLVIDELGSEDDVSHVKELLYKRHDLDAPTWVTTWLSRDEIAARYGGGAASRLFEKGIVLDLEKAP